MKLTQPQYGLLCDIEAAGSHGLYVHGSYKPALKLAELGLVEIKIGANPKWVVTDKGRVMLETLKKEKT